MAIVIPRPPFDTGIDIVLANQRQIELAAQRTITHAFIESNPIELILTPRTKTVTSAGGFTYMATADRDPQVFRLIEGGSSGNTYRPTSSLDGIERRYDFELLGDFDAIVEIHDTFTYDGSVYEVIEIMPDLQYEVRALVTRHG